MVDKERLWFKCVKQDLHTHNLNDVDSRDSKKMEETILVSGNANPGFRNNGHTVNTKIAMVRVKVRRTSIQILFNPFGLFISWILGVSRYMLLCITLCPLISYVQKQ